MKTHATPLLLLAALFLVQPAHAEQAALDLPGALASALANNSSLRVVDEALPQARAGRDRAFAFIQPSVSLGVQYRINDREIAFDPAEAFGDSSALDDAFSGLYGNIGYIYGSLFEGGLLDAQDCDAIAQLNDFEDCAGLTEALSSDGELVVDGGGSDEPLESFVIQPKEQLFVQAEVVWPLSPRVVPLARAGGHQVDAARAQMGQAREQLIGQVVAVYAAAYQSQEASRLLTEQLTLAEAHVADTELLIQSGVLAPDALLRARVEQARVQLQSLQVQRQSESARRLLGLLMGSDAPPQGTLDLPTPAGVSVAELDLEEARAAAQRLRPERRAAQSQALAAKELVVDSALQFLPGFALTGSWNWTDTAAGFDEQQSSWFVGLGASLPLWDGGLLVHGSREAASRRRQAQHQLDALVEQVDLEVADAHGAWQSSLDALPVAEAELELAGEVYRLVQVRYAAGEARQLEVLDARAALQASELTLLQHQVDVQLRGVELLASTGQLRSWAAGL